jgi:RNA polymerase sigma factor (sigma-70 family)
MSAAPLQTVLRHLRRLVTPDGAGGLTDSQLVERFVASRDEAAFEVLVWRHGVMVYQLCRRLLGHAQDAEDAFQATFLILARKAGSIGKREAVGSWLYKVAYRVALGARAGAARRARLQRPLADLPAPDERDPLQCDLKETLDEELSRLPDKYRAPFILCYLEGKTVEEAARQLGCPRGTVGSRLARGRERLRRRLTGRGVAPTAFALTAALADKAGAVCIPAPLASATARAAANYAAGLTGVTGAVSAEVITLTEGVLHTMFVTKLKTVLAIVLAAAVLAGAGGLSYRMQAAEEGAPTRARPTGAGTGAAAPTPEDRLTLKGWGKAVDPDGDCKFTVEKGKLTITIPGTDHALAVERKQMNAPRVLREMEGDFIIQVKVAGEMPGGATSVVEGRRPFHGAGLLLWVDAKNFIRLERAELNADGVNFSYVSWELRRDGEFARQGNTGDHQLSGKEVYLRLERQGGKVFASVSDDGAKWTPLEPIEVDWPKKIQLGVAAGQNTSTGFAPEFEGYKLYREVGD